MGLRMTIYMVTNLGYHIYLTILSSWWHYNRELRTMCQVMCLICYRRLGPPAFSPHSILSTIPLLMGRDNQQQRNPLRDLGPVCRWQYSKCHLLKRLSPPPLSLSISFHVQTYLYHCQHDYALHCFLSSHLHSCVSMIDSSLPPHNHAYSYMSFLLIFIDIASSAMLFLCIAL